MPELPEVETIARGLASRVTGDVIESVWLGSKPEPLKSAASEIVATLESKRIAAVRRVGKHIVFDLENGGRVSSPVARKSRKKSSKASATSSSDTAQWIVHLGMTGTDAGLQARSSDRETHARGCEVSLRQGTEIRGPASLRTSERGPWI